MISVRIGTLFSGSSANCTYIEADGSAVLIDAGAGIRKLGAALESIGSSYNRVRGIFLTHEHFDHIAGLATILKRYSIPVFANEATREAALLACPSLDEDLFVPIRTGATAHCSPFSVRSFPSLHDSAESVGYVVDAAGIRFGILTDTGTVTPEMLRQLENCRVLVLEANHDEEMLRTGPYPYPLKQRICGRCGHLSDAQCADVICGLTHKPEVVILAHLSKENNTPKLAGDTVKKLLAERGVTDVRIEVAPPDRASAIFAYGEDVCLV